MSRDDSVLYTGSSSASFATPRAQEIKEKREKSLQDKAEKQNALKPSAKLIIAEFQKELDELTKKDFRAINGLITSGIPHALEIDMVSDEKTYQRLKAIQTRIINAMRSPQK